MGGVKHTGLVATSKSLPSPSENMEESIFARIVVE